MSAASNQFLELVSKRYYEIEASKSSHLYATRLFCEGCAQETLHAVLPDEGIYEVYQCVNPNCKTIKKIAVR